MLDPTAATEALIQAGLLQQQYLNQLTDSVDEATYDTKLGDLQEPLGSHQGALSLNSAYETPNQAVIGMDGLSMLDFQASSGQLWPFDTPMPHLITAIDQMAELHLAQNCTPNMSPTTTTDGYERRKVQNRAAQRAYRERKEKALSDLKGVLERKEFQLQALQQDSNTSLGIWLALVHLATQRQPTNSNPPDHAQYEATTGSRAASRLVQMEVTIITPGQVSKFRSCLFLLRPKNISSTKHALLRDSPKAKRLISINVGLHTQSYKTNNSRDFEVLKISPLYHTQVNPGFRRPKRPPPDPTSHLTTGVLPDVLSRQRSSMRSAPIAVPIIQTLLAHA
ncbi:uncharacterized protein HMPREF1541_11114 [Cyphellophora europaea CBS 101466]|uniref:BZIP domain-containing protein n=1 Tax=Cyphellophora europaea (strain CBS 101466) TaxID=1220924 RepID=W2S5A1_CYPE1|nr:uncharacterized protein HMPREF1541_11114 [Cyphellophora europaea CBS 101466]ETN43790.1 hypothetical protein HMPREF1541_11114 [Cyphellophora europaea CBS 101466]